MNDKTSCSRCGICCVKGGAVLHKQDLELVKNNFLPLSALITLRQGELAYDAVNMDGGGLSSLEAEVIKIVGSNIDEGKWSCMFLQGENTCAIYENRPLQCKSFFCEDTSELEKIYKQGHLTREDVLADAPDGWLELAKIHEEKCSLNTLRSLIENSLNDPKLAKKILEIVNYDISFRELCCEKASVPKEMLNCLLGRPVTVFLASFGLGFVNKNEGSVLEKIGINMHIQN